MLFTPGRCTINTISYKYSLHFAMFSERYMINHQKKKLFGFCIITDSSRNVEGCSSIFIKLDIVNYNIYSRILSNKIFN